MALRGPIAALTMVLGVVWASAPAWATDDCAAPVWQDEFDDQQLHPGKWSISLGDGCDIGLCGWGNNEQQSYSSDNISLANGVLSLEARHQQQGTRQYTSAKITTRSLFAQRYGRFEARIRLPAGKGFWPAFWLMPKDQRQPWPVEGEIDILEASPMRDNTVLGALHFGEVKPGNVHYSEALRMPDPFTGSFHIFRLDWGPDRFRWYVDGKLYGDISAAEIAPYHWPFNDQPFYIILNLALGGTLGGEIDNNDLPARLEVDYVRVFAPGCENQESAPK